MDPLSVCGTIVSTIITIKNKMEQAEQNEDDFRSLILQVVVFDEVISSTETYLHNLNSSLRRLGDKASGTDIKRKYDSLGGSLDMFRDGMVGLDPFVTKYLEYQVKKRDPSWFAAAGNLANRAWNVFYSDDNQTQIKGFVNKIATAAGALAAACAVVTMADTAKLLSTLDTVVVKLKGMDNKLDTILKFVQEADERSVDPAPFSSIHLLGQDIQGNDLNSFAGPRLRRLVLQLTTTKLYKA
jgi:hypothetical protein